MRIFANTIALLVTGFCFIPLMGQAAEDNSPKMTIDGTGFFKDRILQKQLEAIFENRDTFYDPADIEDAALIIISEIQNDGHLEAKVAATITTETGELSTAEWDKRLNVFLPKEIKAVRVEFKVTPGPLFYYNTLTLEGSTVLSFKTVESFFYSEPFFFSGETSKVFTQPDMTKGTQNLQSHLKNLGYQSAKATAEVANMDTNTGATDVRILISQGPMYHLKEIVVDAPKENPITNDFSKRINKPYNTFVRQDIIQEIRNAYYSLGFTEVKIEHEATSTPATAEIIEVLLNISVVPGRQFSVSSITFEGAKTVQRKLLENQLTFQAGDFLNPGQLDESRLNLSRLGLFQKVDIQVDEVGENVRSITYKLTDRTSWEVDSLLGWGSYENLRVGIMAEKVNAFGLGHRLRLKSVVSTKSLLGETRYLIPNFLESEFPLSSKLFFLEREELSFDRQELGVNFGTSRYLKFLDMTMEAVYTFEDLDARINERGGTSTGPDSVRSGSVELRFSRDKRDNPLNPQSGYRFFGDFQWGSEALGGQVDYQAADAGFSYHNEIKRGLIWHGSISHAVVGSFYKSQSQIPTNKLLYPGGENSIRGYERGGAAPFDDMGDFLGAKSTVILNLELEQRLTDSLSVVGFYDWLGMTKNIEEYPFDEHLSSIGLGIRLRTFMGPVRLEYGHNLDQRIGDPSGTYHLTIGYPF
jgi:outer membrane protein insertion porin family